MMWLNRWISMNSVTSRLAGSQILRRSLRAKSTSIRCSLRSLLSLLNSEARAMSAAELSPLGLEPAIGWVTARPPLTFTSASGDDPATAKLPEASLHRVRYMYGDGFVALNAL